MRLFLILSIFLSVQVFSFGQKPAELELADQAFNQGDYATALCFYSKLVQKTEEKGQLHYYVMYMKAFCNYNLNNFSEAKVELEKVLTVKKSNDLHDWLKGNSYWLIGRIYSKQNEAKKSLSYLRKACKYVQNSYLYSTVAYKEIQMNKLKEALKNLNLAIELDDKNAYAYNNRGLLFLKQGDFESARKDVNASLKLDSTNPYAYKHSAMIYLALKDYENACVELTKAEELGYANFGNESDSKDVEVMIKKYCQTTSN